jgi:hypothetical protein
MGNTVIITQTEDLNTSSTHSTTRHRVVFGMFGIVCCAAVVVAAVWFQHVVHFYSLRQTTADMLHSKATGTEAQQRRVLETVDFFKHETTRMPPAIAGDLGYLSMLAAQWENPYSLEGRIHALGAKTPLEKAIASRPSDAFTWSRLAFVYTTLLQPKKALAAWRMSINAAPFEPTLLLWQIGFSLPLYDTLSDTDQQRVQQQVLNLWRFSRWQTAKILAEFQRPELLRPRLIESEGSKDFEQAYRHFLSIQEK